MPTGIPAKGWRKPKPSERLIAHNGKTQTVKQWSDELGISNKTICARIRNGWDMSDALLPVGAQNPNKPPMTGKYWQKHKQGETHRLIAAEALGKPLPPGAEVHHVDGNGLNNDNTNLVICPNKEYHRLLHIRTAALDACGNANYRKCVVCKQYDDPSTMHLYIGKNNPNGTARHRSCHAKSEAKRKS